MSTYANIEIEDNYFHVRSDGWDKKTMRDCVREYVAEIKGEVKRDTVATLVEWR